MQNLLRKLQRVPLPTVLACAVVVIGILASAPQANASGPSDTVTQVDADTFRVDNAASGFDCSYTWGVNGTVDLRDTSTNNQLASGQYGTCTYLGGNSFEISYSQWSTQPTTGQTVYIYYNKNSVIGDTHSFRYSSPAPSVTQIDANTFLVDNASSLMDCNYTYGVNGTVDLRDAATGSMLGSGQYGTCTYLGGNLFEISYSQWSTQPTTGQAIYLYYNDGNLRQVTNTIAY